MSGIFGALNLSDTDRVFNATVGQQAIYDAVADYVAQYNADMEAAMSVFVERTTTDHTYRYKLPGNGYMQRRGQVAPVGAKKAAGEWDVAFPLEDFGDSLADDDITRAYMTVAELDRHVSSIVIGNRNTRRYEILRALFNSTAGTFVDQLWGSLTIQRLANGDSVTYPPVLGSVSDATENHYLETGYAASSISDTNNPIATGVAELEEHFGIATGVSRVVCFTAGGTQKTKLQALTNFVEVVNNAVTVGDQTATVSELPVGMPGRVLGYTDGAWVVEWPWIPANYLVFVHLDAPKPLIQRVDPVDTGIQPGLQLVAKDAQYPFEQSYWRDRFGFGVGNRLNGVVIELGTGGTYTVPSGY